MQSIITANLIQPQLLLLSIIIVPYLSACGYGAGTISSQITLDACVGGRISHQEAFSRFKRLADEDNTADALLLTARMYAQGDGTSRNIAKAKEYYEKATLTHSRFNRDHLAIEELAELQKYGKLQQARRTCPCKSPTGIGNSFDNRHRCQTLEDILRARNARKTKSYGGGLIRIHHD
ncbi:MAG: SEL1-like repeat protein [Neisseriaceae bacterium]|nr:SEL1-like repeat protein [Neisseriaceae bacterium]